MKQIRISRAHGRVVAEDAENGQQLWPFELHGERHISQWADTCGVMHSVPGKKVHYRIESPQYTVEP